MLLSRISSSISSSQSAAPMLARTIVVGMGSNVVDRFHRVRKVAKAGDKGYFSTPSVVEATVVGGVTLNHLGWASRLGVPTGLLAMQGTDDVGERIRAAMDDLGVSKKALVVSRDYSSSVSLIFLEDGGERCIMMAPGATSHINADIVKKHFAEFVKNSATVISTEISQVPISGVQALLDLGKEQGIKTCIDVDVPPSVAEKEAKLGSVEEVCRAVKSANVVKPTLDAALELIQILDEKKAFSVSAATPLNELASVLVALLKCEMVAITDGHRGAGLATQTASVTVGCYPVSAVVDTTGAGDAFFGGLIASIYHHGVAKTAEDLIRCGELSAALGAVCVQHMGALPPTESATAMSKYLASVNPAAAKLMSSPTPQVPHAGAGKCDLTASEAFERSFRTDGDVIMEQLTCTKKNDIVLNIVATLLAQPDTARIFTSGLGKSGIVAQRMAASLSSLGCPTEFVHATEWFHGDFGKINNNMRNVIFAFSNSGETHELVRLAEFSAKKNATVIAITSVETSTLSRAAKYQLLTTIPPDSELLGLVPTASIIAQESMVNAILRAHVANRKITQSDFKENHPGGNIGSKK